MEEARDSRTMSQKVLATLGVGRQEHSLALSELEIKLFLMISEDALVQPGRGRSTRVTYQCCGCHCPGCMVLTQGWISSAERPVWNVCAVQQEQAKVRLAAGQPWEYLLQGEFHCLCQDCSVCLVTDLFKQSQLTCLRQAQCYLCFPGTTLCTAVWKGQGRGAVRAWERNPAHSSIGPVALHFPKSTHFP